MPLLLQLVANGVVLGVLYALASSSFGLVYRATRVFHVSIGGVFLAGGYGFWVAEERLYLSLPAALIAATGCAVLVGCVTEAVLYRPFSHRRASSGATLVASLGLYVIMENGAAVGFGNELRTLSRRAADPVLVGPIEISTVQLAQLLLATVALLALGAAIAFAPWFRGVWAIGDEPDLVPVLGLPLYRYRMLVFAMSSALIGLASCLVVMDVGITPRTGFAWLFIGAVSALAGGVGRPLGWVVGAMLLSLVQALVIWQLSARWVEIVQFGLLVLALVFRPAGLLGPGLRAEET